MILDAHEAYEQIMESLAGEIKRNDAQISLLAVAIGNNPAQASYIKSKSKIAASLGIGFELKQFDESVSRDEVKGFILEKQKESRICGIIFEKPYPEGLSSVVDELPAELDVDGAGSKNLGLIVKGKPLMVPATVQSALYILDHYGIETRGKKAVVVGRSESVGLPLALMLLSRSRNATVTVCHTATPELGEITKGAEILFVAAGKPGLIREEMVSEGAVVVDIGINFVEKGNKRVIVGDVDFEGVVTKASAITPVPGGVGLLTPLFLMKNLLMAWEIRRQA